MSEADDIKAIREDVKWLKDVLLIGTGKRPGVFERLALVEQTNALKGLLINVLVGVGSAVGVGLLLR
jgi:hypothetical protein